MSDIDSTAAAPEGAVNAQGQRRPLIIQVMSAIAYMSRSAQTESQRTRDTANAILLPISCVLLMLAICLTNTPELKVLTFALPLITFAYYIATRIGIANTFTPRQAYLNWHILIATFLLGGTTSLFLVYLGTCIVLMVKNQ